MLFSVLFPVMILDLAYVWCNSKDISQVQNRTNCALTCCQRHCFVAPALENMILQLRTLEHRSNYFPEDIETLTEEPPRICSHITPSSRSSSLAEKALGTIFTLQRRCIVTQEFIQSVTNPQSFSVTRPHPLTEDRVCSRYSYELRLLLFLVHWEDRIGIYLYWHTFTPSLTFFGKYLPQFLFKLNSWFLNTRFLKISGILKCTWELPGGPKIRLTSDSADRKKQLVDMSTRYDIYCYWLHQKLTFPEWLLLLLVNRSIGAFVFLQASNAQTVLPAFTCAHVCLNTQ